MDETTTFFDMIPAKSICKTGQKEACNYCFVGYSRW